MTALASAGPRLPASGFQELPTQSLSRNRRWRNAVCVRSFMFILPCSDPVRLQPPLQQRHLPQFGSTERRDVRPGVLLAAVEPAAVEPAAAARAAVVENAPDILQGEIGRAACRGSGGQDG